MADMLALVYEVLIESKKEIRDGNTDPWKSYWNTDKYGKPTTQRVEEVCRNPLLEFIKGPLKHYRIRVEPEVHFADDKRADIVALHDIGKLPIEIKRDSHDELWTAQKNQLERFYTRDPESQGYGIFLVFWFGEEYLKSPPRKLEIVKPKDPDELKLALENLQDDEVENKIRIDRKSVV